MPATIEYGRPNFNPRDVPMVKLTALGRAFGSQLRFPVELEEIIPKFLKEKAEKEAAKRSVVSEDWFDAKSLFSLQEALYEFTSSCNFRPDVELAIQKATKRVIRWDDLDIEIRDIDIQRISSLLAWCLLIGIRLERRRMLRFKELLSKSVELISWKLKKFKTRKK